MSLLKSYEEKKSGAIDQTLTSFTNAFLQKVFFLLIASNIQSFEAYNKEHL